MTDSSRATLLAPVAEYRGVALVERSGDQRSAWRGAEYRTDGQVHLLKRSSSDDALDIWTLESEKAAKAVIDSMHEQDSPACGLDFLSVSDVLKTSKAPKEVIAGFLRWQKSGGHWEWDDLQEVFVPKSSC